MIKPFEYAKDEKFVMEVIPFIKKDYKTRNSYILLPTLFSMALLTSVLFTLAISRPDLMPYFLGSATLCITTLLIYLFTRYEKPYKNEKYLLTSHRIICFKDDILYRERKLSDIKNVSIEPESIGVYNLILDKSETSFTKAIKTISKENNIHDSDFILYHVKEASELKAKILELKGVVKEEDVAQIAQIF